MLMPTIPEQPDGLLSVTPDDLTAGTDVVDLGNNEDMLLLESQAKITG